MKHLTMFFTICALLITTNSSACNCDGAPSAFSYTQTATDITFSATKGYTGDCGTPYSMLVEIKPLGVAFDGTNLFTGPPTSPIAAAPYNDLVLTNAMIEASVGVFPSYQARVAHNQASFGNCNLFLDNGTTFSFAPISAVPTLGEWGLILFALLLLNTAALFLIKSRRKVSI